MASSENLTDLAMRRPDEVRMTPDAARRHSQFVRRLRLIVPAIGAGVVATFIFSATPPVIDQKFLRDFENIDTESKTMQLNRPRYMGDDLEGQPFEVGASVASRNPDTPGLIALENPQAYRQLGTDEDVQVKALRGMMDTDSKRLDLNDQVQLDHVVGGSAFTINTDAAEVDFENKTITSVAGVSGHGDRGTVDADTVKVYQDEGRAVFEGNVKFQIVPNSKKDEKEDGPE